MRVQLLQHDHRQEDVVFLEAEQAGWVVQQHVGVQHKHLLGTGLAISAGFAPGGWRGLAGGRCNGFGACLNGRGGHWLRRGLHRAVAGGGLAGRGRGCGRCSSGCDR
ncbi:hypothetical protein SDC9_179379 [bioreactor metagenome]|uniref:Uncharacterized protein n=1 Tax=bioreactor metagenome TaxID=1076179 RepID=A0A645H6K9_9ZZZZ